jgi:hypothetical protein
VGAYCVAQRWFSFDYLWFTTGCVFPCLGDTDCFPDELCACSPFMRASTGATIELGACRGSACKVDADCGRDALCSAPLEPVPFEPDMPPTFGSFACTTARDECQGNLDCPPPVDKSCCAENPCTSAGGDHRACRRREHCGACD